MLAFLSIKPVTTHRWSCRSQAKRTPHCEYQQIKSALDQSSQNNTQNASVRLETGVLTQSALKTA